MATFLLVVFLWIFSVCLHEFAHARVAYDGGDLSVKDKGYLSMNPLKYLDPMYSVIMPVVFLVMGGIGLPGAAVYIDRSRLRSAHWESAVSLAGPAANLALLFVIALLFGLPAVRASAFAPALAFVGLLQASAVVLNLIPLPGFDGYGAISPYLPPAWRSGFDRYSGYAIWALFLALVLVPPAGRAFWAIVSSLADVAGVPLQLAMRGYAEFRFWK
jgi:Zn-dependent protease